MDDAVERTLCQLPNVHVFRIPTRTSADGYRAADWPKDPNWTGKLKVVTKNNNLAVILMDAQNNTFAVCHVTDDSSVERTLDSGRYFALKITNAQGRHAFIGIAFNERSEAFDFNVALSTFKTEMEREQKAATSAISAPEQDFSLKSGEKIKIKLVSIYNVCSRLVAALTLFIQNPKRSAAQEDGGAPAVSTSQLKPPSSTTTAPKPSSSADPFGSDPFGGSSDPFSYSDPFGSS